MLEIAQTVLLGVIANVIFALAIRLWSKFRSTRGHEKPLQKSDGARSQLDDRTQKGRYAFWVGCLGLLAFAMWTELLGPISSNYLIHSDATLLVRKVRWVAYEPRDFDPSSSSNPDLNLMDQELGWIKQAGFDGIITFTSRGTFSEIPALAKKKNLAVIMGIWDPTNREEIAAAVSKQQYVDAYCVGHDGLNYDYSYDTLVKAINHVRFRTGRPVTTTEKIDHYLNDERLLVIGDWLFPDCLLPIRDPATNSYAADANRDVKKTIELANQLAAKVEHGDRKPILLKMVGYPYSKDTDCELMAESDEQEKFFSALTDAQQDVGANLSTEASISVYSAFDLTWKTGRGFYQWERCTGLLNEDGTPRPAVKEIMRRRVR